MVSSLVSRSSKCNGDQNVFVEYNFFYKKLLNWPPQNLISWNDLALAHYVGYVT
jgi:hypothetical protein